jgi:arylsulfatase A-like enzyme
MHHILLCLLLNGLGMGASPAEPVAPAAPPSAPIIERPNLLVIVLDDVGMDKIAAYGEHPGAGPTPIMDFIARQGVLYRNAWATPLCAPTRASALTGRFPFRHGIGNATGPDLDVFSDDEVGLPAVLAGLGYRTGLVGKYHMAKGSQPSHPIQFGFENHEGRLFNVLDYFDWTHLSTTAAGTVTEQVTEYATTREIDDSLALIDGWDTEPWFLWLALDAPHKPIHIPPAHLHTQGSLLNAGPVGKYRAMLEAADTEIGRLLNGIRPAVRDRTYIVILGDNGTYKSAITLPFGVGAGNKKGDVGEGGINVPFFVYGPGIVPGERKTLLSVVDIFPTLIDLAGGSNPRGVTIDGVSFARTLFAPQLETRETVYSELHKPNGFGPYFQQFRTVRNERYKLVRRLLQISGDNVPVLGFYDLELDPFEEKNLIGPAPLSAEHSAVFAELDAVLELHK